MCGVLLLLLLLLLCCCCCCWSVRLQAKLEVHAKPQDLLEELDPVLDEDVGVFVEHLWRMLARETLLMAGNNGGR